MKKILLVIDMQNDFIDGSLGTLEAESIVPKVLEKIRNFDGDLFYTMDTVSYTHLVLSPISFKPPNSTSTSSWPGPPTS